MRKFNRSNSRLKKIEEKKSLKQAVFFFFLTVVLLIVVFFLGIPGIVKIAVLLVGKSTQQQTEQNVPVGQARLSPLPQATNSAQLAINGYAPEGMEVKILLNGESVKKTTTDKNGEFSIKSINLKEGNNLIEAVSVDGENKSEAYTTTVFYKKTAPELEITSPSDGDSFFDKDQEIEIKGTTEADSLVTINGHLAILDSSGNFSLRMVLADGENEIKIQSQDKAGNKEEAVLKVNYTP